MVATANLLSDQGAVERNRISSSESHGKASEKECCLPGVSTDSPDRFADTAERTLK